MKILLFNFWGIRVYVVVEVSLGIVFFIGGNIKYFRRRSFLYLGRMKILILISLSFGLKRVFRIYYKVFFVVFIQNLQFYWKYGGDLVVIFFSFYDIILMRRIKSNENSNNKKKNLQFIFLFKLEAKKFFKFVFFNLLN